MILYVLRALQQFITLICFFFCRPDFSTGLAWLGGGYQQHDWKCESQTESDWSEGDEGGGCDRNHNNLPRWGQNLDCDTDSDKKCSFNSFCDGFSDQKDFAAKCKHNYCK